MCRMGEQINTLIRTGCKAEGRLQRERTNEAMVRPTVYGHMVNTVTCSLLEKPNHTHAWRQLQRPPFSGARRRARRTRARKRSTRVLLPKCRALESAAARSAESPASEKIDSNLDREPF